MSTDERKMDARVEKRLLDAFNTFEKGMQVQKSKKESKRILDERILGELKIVIQMFQDYEDNVFFSMSEVLRLFKITMKEWTDFCLNSRFFKESPLYTLVLASDDGIMICPESEVGKP
jgi:hypothetical protein